VSLVSDKPYSVYVLWSATARKFYIDISENVPQRLERHNQGLSRWTARRRPWVLVHTELFPDYRQARRRELDLKRQKCGLGFFQKTGLKPEDFRLPTFPSGS
jgi:putative endonuclease